MFIEFETTTKITAATTDGITFSNGGTLTHYHEQDCCEFVYAAWKDAALPTGIAFQGFETVALPGSGVNILLYPTLKNKNVFISLFVPCYNEQNGYYSSDLAMIYTCGEDRIVEDVSAGVVDIIY